ncbi:hypothetical protein LEMLEM_LOCUS16161 [Lemmus lemmus]
MGEDPPSLGKERWSANLSFKSWRTILLCATFRKLGRSSGAWQALC